ncbi:MAG TPA: GAF domain-containing protein, partial [Anaeromyxobacteraceae bacterium]|nr:GAF domain-containing protein [Anaeromyxobacteraceae bacterium]
MGRPSDRASGPAQGDLLDLVLETAPVAIAVLRAPDFVYEVANPATAALLAGRHLVGRSVAEVVPELAGQLLPLLRRVAETGEPFLATDLPLDLAPEPGAAPEQRWFTFSYRRLPLRPGEAPAVLGTAVETTRDVLTRRAAERMRERALLLASLSEELSAGLDVRRVLQIALHRAVDLLGGVEGAIFLLEPDGQSIRGLAEGWPRERTGAVIPLERVPHTALALREARPVWFARAEAEAEEGAWLDRVGAGSRLTLPLLVSRQVLGVFHVHYATAAAPPLADDAELAAGVASQCALAIDRARAFQVERAARQRLDQGQRLTASLAAARTVPDVARAMFEAGLGAFGALAGFVVAPDGDELVVLDAFGAGAERLRAKARFAVAAHQPLAEAFRTGRSIYLDDADEARRRYPELAETHGPAVLGLAALPLEVEGRTTGALGLAFRPGRALDDDDRAHLAWLATKFA